MFGSVSTPDLSSITDEDKNHVYDPSEDTFLLLDTLEHDSQLIVSKKPTLILEIGCGSGIVSVFSAKVLDAHSPAFIMCTDINKHAANVAQRVSQTNGQSLEIVVTDLVMGFGDQISNKVDLLIFNPPYVVTPSNEVGTKDLSAAWAGGVDGREVTNRLLPKISDILAEGGLFYLVAIKENKIEDIKQILNKQGLTMTVVLTRRSGPELLSTLRFEKIESRVADLPV